MSRIIKAVTLLELLISIMLFSVVILAVSSVDLLSNWQVMSADRRVKVQQEVAVALEHMTKELGKAIGNESIYGQDTVAKTQTIDADSAIWAYIDYGNPPNGQRDDVNDRWIVYRFTGSTGNPDTQFRLRYCPECANIPCTICNPDWPTSASLVSRNIAGFTVTKPANPLNKNYITAQVTACWDATTADLVANPNGTVDNPCVRMDTTIKMPAVSTN